MPRLQPQTGTLLVAASGRSAGYLPAATLYLHIPHTSWTAVGDVSGTVPAAPAEHDLLNVQVAVGAYNGVRLGAEEQPLNVTITAGQVEPVLLGIDSGHLIVGAAYAGNDDVNLGLGELAGKFVPLQKFELTDQLNRPFNPVTIAGKDVVIAAFHTTCHETCPLYTALFAQLAKRIPQDVILAEITTDPAADTPAVLNSYASRVGANWTFATGTTDELTAFWKQFGVQLSSGDTHTSTLALVDRHGYVRLIHRGVPNVGSAMPPSLITDLNPQGLHELGSGGDGWGSPDVLEELLTIAGPEQRSATAGGKAPDFTLSTTDGAKVGLADLAGKPAVINFWRSDCPPCKAEMPILQRQVGTQVGVRLVLVNWGEDAQSARAFLSRIGIHQSALLDSDLTVGRAYGVFALPVTVFVRADGTISGRQIGQLDERVLAAQLSNLTTQ